MNSANTCYKCNRQGHFARECNSNSGGHNYRGSREKCYKCNRWGHFARDCKEEAERCYRCNGDHFAKDCKQSPDVPSYYTCNKPGDIAGSYPEGGGADRIFNQTCSTCKKVGHISRNCLENIKCYKCQRNGHFMRDCDQY